MDPHFFYDLFQSNQYIGYSLIPSFFNQITLIDIFMYLFFKSNYLWAPFDVAYLIKRIYFVFFSLCYVTQNHKTGCTIIISWWGLYDLLCLSETIAPFSANHSSRNSLAIHIGSNNNNFTGFYLIFYCFYSRPTGNTCDMALLALFWLSECQTRSLQFLSWLF